MSKFGTVALISLLFFSELAEAALPLIPYPKSVSVSALNHKPSYCGFSLDSAFSPEVTDAVWGEICSLSDADAGFPLTVKIEPFYGRKGYGLRWNGSKVEIAAENGQYAVWALQTLKQLLRACWNRDVDIRDWSDMEMRVFMDDISRGAVPNMEQMKRQIRLLSELKYNAYMLYNENVISTTSHPDVAPPLAAISLDEMDDIVSYAASYGIEVIGAFQSFGHFEKTLALPQYRDMGLSPNVINPASPKAREFLTDVISELCRHSSSDYFCVFCDETFDIEGLADKEELFAGHLGFLHSLLSSLGKRMVVCGDMMLKYPGILDKISRDVIIFSWNYDDIPSYSGWLEPFKGFELWVAPGVHSSLRMLPDIRAYEGNRRFVTQGFEAGARGTVVCTWDESAYHSVENLTYNAAQFAETMWDTSLTEADAGFRERYETVRFGVPEGVTQIYSGMMALSGIPMFSGMNDRIFYTRFTPESGQPLIVNASQVAEADSVVSAAESGMRRALASAVRGRSELESWEYVLRCYRFMVDARKAVLSMTPETKDSVCDSLSAEIDSLEASFIKWWKRENRDYSFAEALADFESKRDEVRRLKTADFDELEVIDRNNPYMGFFLTTRLGRGDSLSVSSPWPTPGMTYSLEGGRSGRWTKTESLDGLTMNLDGFYDNPILGTEVRSYARIATEEPADVKLLLGYVGKAEVYLGEDLVWSGEIKNTHTVDEFEIPLKLQPGQNHLTIILRKLFPEFVFSVYLYGPQYESNKYRYTIL